MTVNGPEYPAQGRPVPDGDPARGGEPGEIAEVQLSATEVVRDGVAELDVTEVVTQVPVPQVPTAPQQPQQQLHPTYPHPTYPQQPAPYAQPGPYTQPASPAPQAPYNQYPYGQQPPQYPQTPQYPQPPQPPYGQNPQAQQQPQQYPPTPYPAAPVQQPGANAYYGWGVPVPPPAPRPKVPRRTILGATAILLVGVLAFVVGLGLAAPSGGTSSKATTGTAADDEAERALWRTVPVGQLLPAAITREGTESYIRLGINPDETCAKLPGAFTADLAPTKCAHVLTATYVDLTQTVTATVGIVVVSGTSDERQRLFAAWTADAYASKPTMMPHAYPVPKSAAASFGDGQRVAWQSQVSQDGTFLVYAVAGFTDARSGPPAAAISAGSGSALSASSPAVQVAGDLPSALEDSLASKILAAQGGKK